MYASMRASGLLVVDECPFVCLVLSCPGKHLRLEPPPGSESLDFGSCKG